MAVAEHIDVVRAGPPAIADWNAKHRDEGLNLDGADLRYLVVGRTDLRRASLRGADLTAANLVETNLRSADLDGAKLTGAYLRESNCRDASFRNCDLDGSNFTGALLMGADLSGSSLHGTRLTRVTLWGTKLGNADLSHVAGLESVEHLGPSQADPSQLSGNAPAHFVAGLGHGAAAGRVHLYLLADHADRAAGAVLAESLRRLGAMTWLVPRGYHARRLEGSLPPYAPPGCPVRFVLLHPSDPRAADEWLGRETDRLAKACGTMQDARSLTICLGPDGRLRPVTPDLLAEVTDWLGRTVN